MWQCEIIYSPYRKTQNIIKYQHVYKCVAVRILATLVTSPTADHANVDRSYSR